MNDDDLDAELDAYLDAQQEADLAALPEFVSRTAAGDTVRHEVLLDERRVSGLLAKRQRLVDERERVHRRAWERIQPITAWAEDRTSGIDEQVAWIDRNLEQYARTALPQMGRKSLPLPAGTLKLTAPGAPSVDVIDEGEFVAWCLDDDYPERDELLRRTVAVEKAEVKRRARVGPRDDALCDDEREVYYAVDVHGQRIPGVRLSTPVKPRFSVTRPAYDRSEQPTKETTDAENT